MVAAVGRKPELTSGKRKGFDTGRPDFVVAFIWEDNTVLDRDGATMTWDYEHLTGKGMRLVTLETIPSWTWKPGQGLREEAAGHGLGLLGKEKRVVCRRLCTFGQRVALTLRLGSDRCWHGDRDTLPRGRCGRGRAKGVVKGQTSNCRGDGGRNVGGRNEERRGRRFGLFWTLDVDWYSDAKQNTVRREAVASRCSLVGLHCGAGSRGNRGI